MKGTNRRSACLTFAFLIALLSPLLPWSASGDDSARRTIAGRVVDESGTPLAGVLVEVSPLKFRTPGLAPLFETRTDSQGRYAIEGTSPEEEYLLEFFAAGYDYRTIHAGSGNEPPGDTALHKLLTHTLTGRVFESSPHRGAAGAEVVLIGEKSFRASTVADAEGRFAFQHVPANIGQGVIYATGDGLLSQYRMIRNSTGEVDLTLDTPGRVVVEVESETTEALISGCTVVARPEFMSGYAVEAVPADDGTYVFDGIPRGDYLIWVSHPDWFQPPNRGDFLEPTPVSVRPGELASHTVGVREKASILGRVMGPDARPVSGVRVSTASSLGAYHRALYEYATTDAKGRFAIRTGKLAELGYDNTATLHALGEGLGLGAVTITGLQEGEERDGTDQEAVIHLGGTMRASGRVTDPEGRPLAGISVYISRSGWPNCVTDEAGAYELDSFPLPRPAGETFQIQFKAPRPDDGGMSAVLPLAERAPAAVPSPGAQYYQHRLQEATSRHNTHATHDVVLEPATLFRITGQVMGADGNPAAGANLVLYAGNVPEGKWKPDMRPDMLLPRAFFPGQEYAALCRTVADDEGLYTFHVVRESKYSIAIAHFGASVEPGHYSVAVESLDGDTRLLHDVAIPRDREETTLDVKLGGKENGTGPVSPAG